MAGYPETIVVGIDNHGAFRGQEYNLYASETFGPGLGDAFLEFMIKEVKPMIDNRYRTLTGRESTTIMGSSMGGLMAYAGLCKYPEAFYRAGVFSPSLWIAEEYFELHRQKSALVSTEVYMSVGADEGPAMIRPFERMRDTLLDHTARLQESNGRGLRLKYRVSPGATHSESHWSKEFVKAYIWWAEEQSE
jgi:predicted alpha/beta superfamily hydrolase